jgi:hypothetical protein
MTDPRPYHHVDRIPSYGLKSAADEDSQQFVKRALMYQARMRGIAVADVEVKQGTVVLELEDGKRVVASYVVEENSPMLMIPQTAIETLRLRKFSVFEGKEKTVVFAANKMSAARTALYAKGRNELDYPEVIHTVKEEPTEEEVHLDEHAFDDLKEETVIVEDEGSGESDADGEEMMVGFTDEISYHPGMGVEDIIERKVRRDMVSLRDKARSVLQSVFGADYVNLSFRSEEDFGVIRKYSGVALMAHYDYGDYQVPFYLLEGDSGFFTVIPEKTASNWIEVYDVDLQNYGLGKVRVSATSEEEAVKIAVQFAKSSALGKIRDPEHVVVANLLDWGSVRKVTNADWAPSAWSASWVPRPWATVNTDDGLYLVRIASTRDGEPFWKGVMATWMDFESWYFSLPMEERVKHFGSVFKNDPDAIDLHSRMEQGELTYNDRKKILSAFVKAHGVNSPVWPVIVSPNGWRENIPTDMELKALKNAGIKVPRSVLNFVVANLLPDSKSVWQATEDSDVARVPYALSIIGALDWLYRYL